MDWLSIGDKIASIVSAGVALLSLGVSVVALRKDSRYVTDRASTAESRRNQLAIAVPLGLVALAAAMEYFIGAPLLWLLGTATSAAFCALAVNILIWMQQPKAPIGVLRDLLEAQLADAERHKYRFGAVHVAGLSRIYVVQRAILTTPSAVSVPTDLASPAAYQAMTSYSNGLVIAGPGGGKSTLLCHIAGTSASWWLGARRWHRLRHAPYGPVLALRVPATALIDRDIPGALQVTWSSTSADCNRDLFVQPPRRGVDWLVLIDGIDEITDADTRSRVLTFLGTRPIKESVTYRVLATSRSLPTGELAELRKPGHVEFRIQPFDVANLDQFSLAWFMARAISGRPKAEIIDDSRRFLARIRTSRLASITRVPLLVTIAALVYEADSDRPLPTSRADLYREFVASLQHGRAAISNHARTAHLSSEETPIAHPEVNIHALLPVLGRARISDPTCNLLAQATAWLSQQQTTSSHPTTHISSSRALRSALLATSLFVARGNEVDFIHSTVADYFAAEGRPFDKDSWLIEMHTASTRSLALFTLARSSYRAESIVRDLLAQEPPDPIVAGYVIGDGISVNEDTRQEVIDALFDGLKGGDDQVWQCLEVLAELATDAGICDRLTRVARDASAQPWVRVLTAQALAERDPAVGLRLLRETAAHHTLMDSEAGRWGAGQLVAMGDKLGYYVLANYPVRKADMSILPIPALRYTAQQENSAQRLDAALQLSTVDEVGYRVLRELALSTSLRWERVAAAAALAHASDQIGFEILHRLLGMREEELAFRVHVARVLMELGEAAGHADILAASITYGTSPHKPTGWILGWRRAIRESGSLYARDERRRAPLDDECVRAIRAAGQLGSAICADLLSDIASHPRARPDARKAALLSLTAVDEVRGLHLLRTLALDRRYGEDTICQAATMLMTRSEPEGAVVLQSLASSQATGRLIRLKSALVLRSFDDPSGEEVLREISHGDDRAGSLARLELLAKSHGRPSAKRADYDGTMDLERGLLSELFLDMTQADVIAAVAPSNKHRLRVLVDNADSDLRVRYLASYYLAMQDLPAGRAALRALTNKWRMKEAPGHWWGVESIWDERATSVAVDCARDLGGDDYAELLRDMNAFVMDKDIDLGDRGALAWMLSLKGEMAGLDALERWETDGERRNLWRSLASYLGDVIERVRERE